MGWALQRLGTRSDVDTRSLVGGLLSLALSTSSFLQARRGAAKRACTARHSPPAAPHPTTRLRDAPSIPPPAVQDLLLSLGWFQSLLLWVSARRVAATVRSALVEPPPADPASGRPAGLDGLPYFLDATARQTLLHAALHALSAQLAAAEPLAPAVLLPCVSRVLLLAEDSGSDRWAPRGPGLAA